MGSGVLSILASLLIWEPRQGIVYGSVEWGEQPI
jgi:hypothetical protein